MTNVARHAEATEVKITLRERAGKLMLEVGDNGKGITKEETFHPRSLGILGVRERVYYWCGKIKIHGVKGQGTMITVSIPLKREKLNAKHSRS